MVSQPGAGDSFLGSIGLCLLAASVSGDPSPSSIEVACGTADRAIATLAAAPAPIRYGFFTDFDPLSHAATQDPSDPAFDVALGYEPALIAAIGTLSDGRVRFAPRGIGNPFSGIWLRSAGADFDLVGGGITALEQRRYDPRVPRTARISPSSNTRKTPRLSRRAGIATRTRWGTR